MLVSLFSNGGLLLQLNIACKLLHLGKVSKYSQEVFFCKPDITPKLQNALLPFTSKFLQFLKLMFTEVLYALLHLLK